jgi:two-component system response regulator PilR (NtrC family)
LSSQRLIHVIDDEPVIHDILTQLLTSEGYRVEISASGEEALEKFSAERFDLILLDLLMPGMDGIEVLRAIKRIQPQAVVVIITAYASVESAIEAMKIGAFDYVQKPFKHEELLLIVARALEYKALQEENLRLIQEGYRLGEFRLTEVLLAQRDLFETRASYLESIAAYNRSLAEIYGSTGVRP